MVYEGIVELHKVHTEDYKFKTDKKNGMSRREGDIQELVAVYVDE